MRPLGSLAVWLALVLAPTAASAAETGGTWLGLPVWVWLWLNFFIFWGLLIRFIGPLLKKYFRERGEGVRQSMATAREQTEEAQQLRSELSTKLEALRQEIDELQAKSQQEGEREREEILRQAEEERQRILDQTRDEIARGIVQARDELTRHTARLAAELAEKKLAAELDDGDRRRLFAASVERLKGVGQ